jgi:hypothetical protein
MPVASRRAAEVHAATAALAGAPFVIAGFLKIVYDLLLFRGFQRLRPPEEA